MRILMKAAISGGETTINPGDIIDVEDAEAARLIDLGAADAAVLAPEVKAKAAAPENKAR
jgi:hypothetical protein